MLRAGGRRLRGGGQLLSCRGLRGSKGFVVGERAVPRFRRWEDGFVWCGIVGAKGESVLCELW